MDFETLATGYGLLEGPRTDDQNRLYFSDVRGGGVFRRSPDGQIETLIPTDRKAVGGIALNEGGGMLVTGLSLAPLGRTQRPGHGDFQRLGRQAAVRPERSDH